MSKHAFVLFHYQNLLKKYGLIAHAAPISSELSDFLGETDQSIEKLPFIYQRLFKIASLKDRDFFEGHENEILNLGNAYNNWQKGRYAPTFIVGEKGSGKSTLINLFLADLERTYTNQRFNCTTKIYDIPSFLSFFKEIFNHNGFESAEDIINHIQDSRIKQLIIIEDIHHLFIKKVNGFICLKMLFEIISKTNHQIFWLLSATRYSWSYLNKTLDIEDYFGYIINVQELEDEQIIELILKRHRVSGYNLFFQPSQLAKASKQYRKLPDHEKQPYLKNYYFTSLNKFAKDNISLALLFWLRSAKDVKDDTIYIGDLDNLDFTFLSSLSQEKIFVLYALILHDGLTISQLSDIQNKSYDQCKLIIILLWDDGIISMRDSFYIVNPLLYRHVISLLKSKNLLT